MISRHLHFSSPRRLEIQAPAPPPVSSPRRLEFQATCAPCPARCGGACRVLDAPRRSAMHVSSESLRTRPTCNLGHLVRMETERPWFPCCHQPKVHPVTTSPVRLATLVPWFLFAVSPRTPAVRPPCHLAPCIADLSCSIGPYFPVSPDRLVPTSPAPYLSLAHTSQVCSATLPMNVPGNLDTDSRNVPINTVVAFLMVPWCRDGQVSRCHDMPRYRSSLATLLPR